MQLDTDPGEVREEMKEPFRTAVVPATRTSALAGAFETEQADLLAPQQGVLA